MNNWCELLDWDSNFFGFKVCRINKVIDENNGLIKVFNSLNHQQIILAYYSSKIQLKDFDYISDLFEIKLVDKKITYAKKINKNTVFHPSVSVYKEKYPEKRLVDLAIQSGTYSRFNVDERIGREKFEELYTLWIINSVNKNIAREVLVFLENYEIAGFITLGYKNNRGDIGIISVDNKYRGKGIGKALMNSAEKWFADNGYTSIQVVTQESNIPACRLYESCGYTPQTAEYFYHIWRK